MIKESTIPIVVIMATRMLKSSKILKYFQLYCVHKSHSDTVQGKKEKNDRYKSANYNYKICTDNVSAVVKIYEYFHLFGVYW